MNKPSGTARLSHHQAAAGLRHAWCSIRWYVKGLVGENDYERYVTHLRLHDPELEPVTRRDFERAKTDRMESNPKSRCC